MKVPPKPPTFHVTTLTWISLTYYVDMYIYTCTYENILNLRPSTCRRPCKMIGKVWESYIIVNAPIIVTSSTSRPWQLENLKTCLRQQSQPWMHRPWSQPWPQKTQERIERKLRQENARNRKGRGQKMQKYFFSAFLEAGQRIEDWGSQQMLPWWVQRGRGKCSIPASARAKQWL